MPTPAPLGAAQRHLAPLKRGIWAEIRARTVPSNLSELCQATRPLRVQMRPGRTRAVGNFRTSPTQGSWSPARAKQAGQPLQGRDEGGFSVQFPGFCRSRVQHETRGTCATRHIIGPGLGSRFPGGARRCVRIPASAYAVTKQGANKLLSIFDKVGLFYQWDSIMLRHSNKRPHLQANAPVRLL